MEETYDGKPKNTSSFCNTIHLNGSFLKLGKTFGLQQELLRRRTDFVEKFQETWHDLRDYKEP